MLTNKDYVWLTRLDDDMTIFSGMIPTAVLIFLKCFISLFILGKTFNYKHIPLWKAEQLSILYIIVLSTYGLVTSISIPYT